MQVLFMFLVLAGFLQQAGISGYPFGKEFNLEPLLLISQGRIKMDKGLLCGKYFFMVGKDPNLNPDGKHPVVMFQFISDLGLANSQDSDLMFMAREKFTVIMDNNKAVPTVYLAERFDPKDPLPWRWVLKISRRDLQEAMPCIPAPGQ